ncbi:zinc-binding domain-containing protein [Boeremia exigua]|uniref:zinc-binding domain-containing protein n=1 Tax=Boeremia exigua TaxID=749465 RepID=UPI001E8DF11F|nr:zinc-binding domain-containing protein [Boeremia exigua]KAH6643529.1 zinc-binding domain-containing protein [Boeremia exigua]
MPLCVLCDCSFGSEHALKQHQEDSPAHTGTYCKPCKRTFSSNNALKQHLQDSPVHQQQSPEVTSSTVLRTFNLNSSRSPPNARAQRNNRRNSQTPFSNTSTSDSSRHHSSPASDDSPRVFMIPIREPPIKPPQRRTVPVPKRKEETRTSFTFPNLHDRIAEAVLPDVTSTWFQSNDRERSNNEHLTCVVGRFTCDNVRCKKRAWASGVVSIVIRGYAGNGYSVVVFNQRCKSCEKLGTLTIDETTYVERVAFRIKRWAGVWMENPLHNKASKGPHEQELCEGCKRGTCLYTNKSRSDLAG